MIDVSNPQTWGVLALIVIAYVAQLAVRFSWVPRASKTATGVAATIAIGGGAGWPIWSTLSNVFPGSLLNAAQDAVFGSSLYKVSVAVLYLVSFAGFYGWRPFTS